MRIFGRIVFLLALAWLGYVLFTDARLAMAKADALTAMDQAPDHTQIIVLFLSIVGVAVVAGVTIAMSLVPALAEKFGGLFFAPDEQIKDPHAGAVSRMAQGDYEGAVAEYERVFAENPNDTMALSEMARIYAERLHNPEAAAAVIEGALGREWSAEQSVFLVSRLVDVYWNHQHDAQRARGLLEQIIENLPNSSHSINAQHRLKEIDHATAGGAGRHA